MKHPKHRYQRVRIVFECWRDDGINIHIYVFLQFQVWIRRNNVHKVSSRIYQHLFWSRFVLGLEFTSWSLMLNLPDFYWHEFTSWISLCWIFPFLHIEKLFTEPRSKYFWREGDIVFLNKQTKIFFVEKLSHRKEELVFRLV